MHACRGAKQSSKRLEDQEDRVLNSHAPQALKSSQDMVRVRVENPKKKISKVGVNTNDSN